MRTCKPLKKCLSFIILTFIFSYAINAQEVQVSYGGIFDTVYDSDGEQYYLSSLLIDSPYPLKKIGGSGTTHAIAASSCSAGIFNVYFASNLTFAGVSTPTFVQQGKDIICRVLSDLSVFIKTYSLNLSGAPKINIYCGNASAGNLLAQAKQFYVFPPNPINPLPGLIDGQIHKALLTSKDPYSDIPLNFNDANQFFHGQILVSGTNSLGGVTYNWHMDGATVPGVGIEYDLYSAILHEVGHALGFSTLIDGQGQSALGATHNFFQRYDTYLKDAAGSPLLGLPTVTSCISSLSYTANLSAIAPGGSCSVTIPTCSTAAQYSSSSVHVEVHTPNCYSSASSPSHLSDMCTTASYTPAARPTLTACVPTPTAPGVNGLEFLMSAGAYNGPCGFKRYYQDLEKEVFCDLGYTLAPQYQSATGTLVTAFSNIYNYGSSCTPMPIVGMNDGLVNGVFVYTTSTGAFSVATSSILSNEIYAGGSLSLACLEIVYTNSLTQHAAAVSGSSVVISGNPGSGLAIAKYTPVNSSNEMGNATYIFVYFLDANCNPGTSCNLVQNGGFESSTGSCGTIGGLSSQATRINCWEEYPINSSPYLYARNCTVSTTFDLGSSTLGSGSVAVNSVNGNPNNKLVALTYTNGATGSNALKNHLSAPLLPGQVYDVSFLAINHQSHGSSVNTNTNNNAVVLTIATQTVFTALPPGAFPAGLETVAEFTIPASSAWAKYNLTFTFPSTLTVNHEALVIGINPVKTAQLGTWVSGMTAFCFLDELSVLQNPSPAFTGSTICGNQTINDLDAHLAGAVGTYSGTGVDFINGLYQFNAQHTLTPGEYWIVCSYTTPGNCTHDLYAYITVSSNTNFATLTPTTLCMNTPTLHLNSILIAPPAVTGGTFSVNGTPVGSTASISPPGPTTISFVPTGSNLCTYAASSVAVNAYTVASVPGVLINNFTQNSTVVCSGQPVAIEVSPSADTFVWQPGSLTGTMQVISPTASIVYTVAHFDTYSVCPATETIALTTLSNCCGNTTMSVFGYSAIPSSTGHTGPYKVASSFTVNSPAVLIMDAEWRFAPEASITISSGAQLVVTDAHLYSCDNEMWPGIVVEDGGKVFMYETQSDNLIEDAITALDCSNQYTSNSGYILNLTNTTFNRNHTSIRVTNFDKSFSPLALSNCVFTSRTLTYTSSQWPQTATSAGGLRSATNPTTGILAPYTLQGAALAKLKAPYGDYYARKAIDLVSVAQNTFGNYYGASIGSASTAAEFNLFDGHERFIVAENSNLKIENNVFQNTQRYYVPSDPVGTFSLVYYYPVSAIAVNHISTNTVNTQLNSTAASQHLGNRFWDCHHSINAHNIYSVTIDHAIFRSTQGNWSPGLTFYASWFGLNNLMPGQSAVTLNSNRFRYKIEQNEISNINVGVSMGLLPNPFSTVSGTAAYGIDAGSLTVKNNTVSPEPPGVTFTTGFSNIGISIAVPLSNTFSAVSASSLVIEDNHLNRVFRGISVNGMSGFPVAIRNNSITQATDNQFNAWQRGIELVNTIGTSSSCCNNVVEDNTISATNPSNTLGALLYASMNAGPTSPRITCNILKDAMKGFVFSGPNPGTYWRGNKMENLGKGMELSDYGVIGTQGSSGAPSDNQWLVPSAWTGTTYGTYVDASSSAASSTLFVKTGTWTPSNNGGLAQAQDLYGWLGNMQNATGAYICGGSPSQITIPIPATEEYDTEESFYIARTVLYRMLYYNPDLRDESNPDALSDWYYQIDHGTIPTFLNMEALLSTGEISEAKAINDNFDQSTMNQVEKNYVKFYSLYCKYADQDETGFSVQDSADLFDLVSLCPALHGGCIYQAQALGQIITGQPFYFESECASGSGDRKRSPQADSIQKVWQVDLFPNPNYGNFALISNRDKEVLNVEIIDSSGRLVFEKKIQISAHIHVLDLKLDNGIYFVKVTNNNNERIVKKMVVAK